MYGSGRPRKGRESRAPEAIPRGGNRWGGRSVHPLEVAPLAPGGGAHVFSISATWALRAFQDGRAVTPADPTAFTAAVASPLSLTARGGGHRLAAPLRAADAPPAGLRAARARAPAAAASVSGRPEVAARAARARPAAPPLAPRIAIGSGASCAQPELTAASGQPGNSWLSREQAGQAPAAKGGGGTQPPGPYPFLPNPVAAASSSRGGNGFEKSTAHRETDAAAAPRSCSPPPPPALLLRPRLLARIRARRTGCLPVLQQG